MIFNFQKTVLTMLFTKFVLVAVVFGIIIFMVVQLEQILIQVSHQQTELQKFQQRSTGNINKIISNISSKIDNASRNVAQILQAQGNFSSQQRQALIKEFVDPEQHGGLATKEDVKSVVTQLDTAKNATALKNVQADNNHLLHEILGNLTVANNTFAHR